MRTALVLALALLAGGCFNRQISVVEPHPNVVFTQSSAKSLLLRIQKSVPDQFTVQVADWFETPVDGWHQTLANGFRNGFAGYFAPSSPSGPVDLRLELERAELQWAYVGRGLAAHVVYRARLVDRDGRSIATAAGTASSKTTWVNGLPMDACVASSIESMYEELTEKLLRRFERVPRKSDVPPAGAAEI